MTYLLAPLLWYGVISLAGWAFFPFVYQLFPSLPDRGYSLSRIAAWLLWGFSFWLLASLRLLQNNPISIIFSFCMLLACSAWAFRMIKQQEFIQWLRSNFKLILVSEIIFILSFFTWIFLRSTNPEIAGTEKPMELAFINAILHSPTFPPHDPWLSGYAISYYYFGYVLVAMIARLAGTSGGISFNIAISLIFSLGALASYGLIYNLYRIRSDQERPHPGTFLYPLLGPSFLLLFSNLEGFLHALHRRGLFWTRSLNGVMTSSFWKWLDIKDLNIPPTLPLSWIPDQFWWWWRASRVIQDYDLAGNAKEIIQEFPFFSFLLADLHPHVLAIPFALLAVTISLHSFLHQPAEPILKVRSFHVNLSWEMLFFSAVALGALGFMNTWDLPVYVALFAGCYATGQIFKASIDQKRHVLTTWIKDFVFIGLLTGFAGIIIYLPFYLGFSSQAGGLIINLIYPTRGAHLWVVFGGLIFFLSCFFGILWIQFKKGSGLKQSFWNGLGVALGLVCGLWLVSLALGVIAMANPELKNFYLSSLAAGSPSELFISAIVKRLTNPGGWLTLFLLLVFACTLILQSFQVIRQNPNDFHRADLFVLLLIFLGSLLVLGVEFFFLRDQFGWRMNSIFKFYYQAWLLWALAAAYACMVLLRSARGLWGILFRGGVFVIIAASLVYPTLSLPEKTNQFRSSDWGLDGTAYLAAQNPDEAQAIQWLQQAPFGVVAEAVSPSGGSYTNYARVSTLSGLPGVLGWMGHESQWRGGGVEMGSRQADMTRLYCSTDPLEIQDILTRYAIRYVFLGALERSTYTRTASNCEKGLNEFILKQILNPVFQSGNALVFSVPGR
jgi:YYY domain-containing protein